MTEKELGEYKAIKTEIADLTKRIEETKQADILQFGTVKGSSKYFPYTAKSFKVAGVDPKDIASREAKITELLRQREVKRDELIKKQIEIERYISEIKDSNTRTMFRLYFIDGEKQTRIAKKLGFDQSSISYRIKNYISRRK